MFKHQTILDKDFNIIEFIEFDYEGDVISQEWISYYDNGQIKRKECSNGQITEWNREGRIIFTNYYTSYISIHVTDLLVQLDETIEVIDKLNTSLQKFNQRLIDILGVPKQYINDT